MKIDQIPGQMSIFDFLKSQEKELDNLPEAEMVRMVADATGLDFQFRDAFWGWQYAKRGVTFSIQYEYYFEDGRRMIGADWNSAKQGQASPCDSVQEAIDFFKRAIKRLNEGERIARKGKKDGREKSM